MFAQLLAAPLSRETSLLLFTVGWLAATAFWLWMLVDCLTKKRLRSTEKIVWVLVLLFTHAVGALLYLVLVRRRRPGGA